MRCRDEPEDGVHVHDRLLVAHLRGDLLRIRHVLVGVDLTQLWLDLGAHELQLRRALQPRILGYSSAVGAVGHPEAELAEQFRMPLRTTTHQELLTMSRAILERATARKGLLVKLGMSEPVLDELATALGQYEDTLQATSGGRREHVGARADLKAVAADISKQLRLLDKVVRYRFGGECRADGSVGECPQRGGLVPDQERAADTSGR